MGQPESKQQDSIVEAYGFTLPAALQSLDALLRVKYRAVLRTDEAGYSFVQADNGNRYYVQNQPAHSEQNTLYRVFFRIPYA